MTPPARPPEESAHEWGAGGSKLLRHFVFPVLAVGLSVALSLGVAEVVLRFMPVLSNLYALPVNAGQSMLRYEPNRRFTYSAGPTFEIVTHGRVNNAGWVNEQDYDSAATSSLLAVIGDSYVEALMVPYPETLQGRLAARVRGIGRVYSFGISGAPLSHYLAMADYVRRTYRPNGEVVVVVGNDFDESLLKYKTAPGLWVFGEDSASSYRLHLVDYTPSRWKRLLRHSAVVRYATLNLHIGETLDALLQPSVSKQAYAGNVSAHTDSVRLADSERAADAFLEQLPSRSGLPPDRIAIVVDGVRPQLYDPTERVAGDTSYFGLMRQYLMAEARRHGFVVIDMEQRLVSRYVVEHRRFEFPADGHWNALGHAEAARAVEDSPLLGRIFGH